MGYVDGIVVSVYGCVICDILCVVIMMFLLIGLMSVNGVIWVIFKMLICGGVYVGLRVFVVVGFVMCEGWSMFRLDFNFYKVGGYC